jgi:hypothetical protein
LLRFLALKYEVVDRSPGSVRLPDYLVVSGSGPWKVDVLQT